jgi:hypothetical protein
VAVAFASRFIQAHVLLPEQYGHGHDKVYVIV